MARYRRPPNLDLAGVVSYIYANTEPEGGCLIAKLSHDKDSYVKVNWRKRTWLAHRLVAQHYLGPCPEGQEVLHMCGRGMQGCVTASHMRYGTHKENVRHTIQAGKSRSNAGEGNGNAKLTWADVEELRRLSRDGWKPRHLCQRYGITRSHVCSIVNNKSWIVHAGG